MQNEIAHRIMVANRAFYSLNRLFKSKLLFRTCKLNLYKTIVRPILCYNAETWTMTNTEENKLRVFERKILRKVFGPVKDENQEYRNKYNLELLELMEGEDVVKRVDKGTIDEVGKISGSYECGESSKMNK